MSFLNDVHSLGDTSSYSLAASFTTAKTYTGEPGNPTPGFCIDKCLFGYAVQAVWTGSTTPAGTLTLECSNDNITFITISGTSTAVSGAGNVMWTISTPYYKFVRARYVRSSGGASDTVTFSIRAAWRS